MVSRRPRSQSTLGSHPSSFSFSMLIEYLRTEREGEGEGEGEREGGRKREGEKEEEGEGRAGERERCGFRFEGLRETQPRLLRERAVNALVAPHSQVRVPSA
eukprot:416918-Rhodomonas_salina.1